MMSMITNRPIRVLPRPRSAILCTTLSRPRRCRSGYFKFFLKCLSTRRVSHYDACLSASVSVFESEDDHAVPVEAPAPALVAVVWADLAGFDERDVAVEVDVVVTGIALRAVEA